MAAKGSGRVRVIGVENEGKEITPLYGKRYSSQAQDCVSENREILRALGKVSPAMGERGIWVIDRVRQVGERHLLSGPRRELALQIALECSLPYQSQIMREVKGQEQVSPLS